MKISFAFHLIGMVLWFSGLLVVTGIHRYFANHSEATSTNLKALSRKYWVGFVIPGLVISLTSGIFQLVYTGVDFYMKQGWFHTKLTLVAVLLVLTVVVGFEVKRVQDGGAPNGGKMSKIHGVAGLLLVAIIFLTIVGRP